MSLLGFDHEFTESVFLDRKTQSIRPDVELEVGDRVILFGRSEQGELQRIGEGAVYRVAPVEISGSAEEGYNLQVNGADSLFSQRREIAIREGFTSVREMAKWFEKKHGLPFKGQMIRWIPAMHHKYKGDVPVGKPAPRWLTLPIVVQHGLNLAKEAAKC